LSAFSTDSCPACDADYVSYRRIDSLVAEVPDGLDRGPRVSVHIERCIDCGLFRVVPVSDDRSSSELYNDDSVCFAASASKISSGVHSTYSTDELSIVGVRAPARVLDVGCGAGQFLMRFEHLGMEPFGVDADPAACASVSKLGYTVWHGEMNGVPAGMKFDLVSAIGVLEHIDDPLSFLRELAERVAPAGEILIGVPNARSLNRLASRLSSHDWDMFLEPGHRWGFDVVSLSRLARRARLSLKASSTATILIRGKIPFFPARRPTRERRIRTLVERSAPLRRSYEALLKGLDKVNAGDALFATFSVPKR
jgi:SAM-dependent methyltransferase